MTEEQLEQMIQAIREIYDDGLPLDMMALALMNRIILTYDHSKIDVYAAIESVLNDNEIQTPAIG